MSQALPLATAEVTMAMVDFCRLNTLRNCIQCVVTFFSGLADSIDRFLQSTMLPLDRVFVHCVEMQRVSSQLLWKSSVLK